MNLCELFPLTLKQWLLTPPTPHPYTESLNKLIILENTAKCVYILLSKDPLHVDRKYHYPLGGYSIKPTRKAVMSPSNSREVYKIP